MTSSFPWSFSTTCQPDWNVTVVDRDADANERPLAASGAGNTALADLDDAAQVAACVAGRPGAFDLVVERHRRAVYQLCYRFVGNHEDASDLSQEVLLRAFRGLRTFRGRSSLAT